MPLLSTALRLGLRRGLSQGSRAWLALGLGAGALKALRRLGSPHPVRETIKLAPGQRLEIRHYRRGEHEQREAQVPTTEP